MTNEQALSILEGLRLQTQAQQDTHLALFALQTAVIGLLRAAAQSPDQAPVVAREISLAAETVHAVGLGMPVTDEYLKKRNAVLQALLPEPIRSLAKIPT